MLTVLIAIALSYVESKPPTLPLPPVPLGLTVNPAEYRASLELRLDTLEVRDFKSSDKSNYELWCENGYEWMKSEEDPPTPPMKAKNVETRRVGLGFGTAYWMRQESCCLPWQRYIGRLKWENRGPHDVVWYTLIQGPSADCPYYLAEIEDFRYLKVRARSVKELEIKVIERYASYLQSLDDSDMALVAGSNRHSWVPSPLNGWDVAY